MAPRRSSKAGEPGSRSQKPRASAKLRGERGRDLLPMSAKTSGRRCWGAGAMGLGGAGEEGGVG